MFASEYSQLLAQGFGMDYLTMTLRFWPFGEVWCHMWLAVDVWLCTASILNLCAISVDRYLAISRPFHYPSLMSSYRAKLLIVSVWILSFVICFPPLVGWNERHGKTIASGPAGNDEWMASAAATSDTSEVFAFTVSYQQLNKSTFTGDYNATLPVCVLNSDPVYVIYSACGSFWIPMIVMVALYWRIYRKATQATEAIRRGFITSCDNGTDNSIHGSKVKESGSDGSGYRKPRSSVTLSRSDNSIVCALRVHRGGGVATGHVTASGGLSPSLTSLASARHSNGSLVDVIAYSRRLPGNGASSPTKRSNATSEALGAARRSRLKDQSIRQAKSEHDLPQIIVTSPQYDVTTLSQPRTTAVTPTRMMARLRTLSGSLSQLQFEGKKIALPFFRLHQQLRSLNREKKAAKTVGVIVGCFIACWAPFFTAYLIGAFCGPRWCTPPTLFDVFFWLGYCNSLANPVIYGLCSRDFRYAFAKLVRCRCERRPVPPQPTFNSGTSTLRRHNSRIGSVLRSFRLQIATENGNDATDSYS